MTTFTDLATRALGNDFPASALPDAKRWVRTGLSELYVSAGFARNDMVDVVVTTIGSPSVPLTYSMGRIRHVVDQQTGEPLEETSAASVTAFVSSTAGNAVRGRPEAFGITGELANEPMQLVVTPIPDKVYTLFVYGERGPQASEMEDADTVPLPERYEDGPAQWARAELFDWLEDDGAMADRWRSKFEDTAKRMRSDLQRRSTTNRRVPGTWSDLRPAGPSFRHPRGLF